jgi:hypothetical protein
MIRSPCPARASTCGRIKPERLGGFETELCVRLACQLVGEPPAHDCIVAVLFGDRHWLDVFKTFYGPMLKAFAALDSNAQVALARDILALADGNHQRTLEDQRFHGYAPAIGPLLQECQLQ